MYGNNYQTPQPYQQDLLNLRDRIDKQLQQMNNKPQPQPVPITQNFQIAPNHNQSQFGIRYANSIDDVKNEMTFMDTLFVNRDFTNLWVKNATGGIKTYELKEIIELDEKDRQIADLKAKIDELEKEIKENESKSIIDANVSESDEDNKPKRISSKSSRK
ncbi:MAG: hypothetical protein PUE33_04830 [bacterium]|nr:hypothetical protein [bacterium]